MPSFPKGLVIKTTNIVNLATVFFQKSKLVNFALVVLNNLGIDLDKLEENQM
tara:strand:- start:75 stop:230 length:156 start_codon:yes stop_codon:yes gene_type:complete